MDWYQYLTLEFKLPKNSYKSNDKAAVTCPKCVKVDLVRINHLKHKVKTLGLYECSLCRKQESIQKARLAFKAKYGDANPYQLETSKSKIRKTLLDTLGVDCALKDKSIHQKGIISASSAEARAKAKETQLKNWNMFNLDVHRDTVNQSLLKKSKELRAKWKREGGKLCGHCHEFKTIKEYASMKYQCSKCKVCTNLYSNEYSQIRRALSGNFDVELSNLGCTIPEFSDYIESQFELGMNWGNWSKTGWHLDHVIPNSMITSDNKHIINNYKNFRPLWSHLNYAKNNKLPKLIILTGCFGSGKTSTANRLQDMFTILDKDLGHDLYDVGRSDHTKPVIYQTSMGVAKDIREMGRFFDVTVAVIVEDLETLESRITGRGGFFNKDSIIKRMKRILSISKKYGSFSGSALNCFEYLKLRGLSNIAQSEIDEDKI